MNAYKLSLQLNREAAEAKDDVLAGETIVHKEGNYVVVTMKGGRKKLVML